MIELEKARKECYNEGKVARKKMAEQYLTSSDSKRGDDTYYDDDMDAIDEDITTAEAETFEVRLVLI